MSQAPTPDLPQNDETSDQPHPPKVSARTEFSFAQARTLIGDLSKPNPLIYWTDFLVTIVVAHAMLFAMRAMVDERWGESWVWIALPVAYILAVIACMRAVMFIHELVHLPRDGFKGFRIAWNLLCGIPFFIPSFLYYPHVDHHRRKHYGTDHDGEYLELSHRSPWLIVGFILQALVIPFLGIFRFVVLSPICWLIPGARQYVHRHASTMVVDPFYERTDGSPKLMRIVVLQEIGCFVVGMGLIFGHLIMKGVFFNPFWIVAYALGVGILTLNEIRTLGAHRWMNQGGEMSFEEQLLDSVNYPNHAWITELWGPIGTRYHALHHLFPRLPYHSMPEAHRRLAAGLPPESPYHKTTASSLTGEIINLFRRATTRENRKGESHPDSTPVAT
ncbi:fatty acid desaturase family protein [Stieleria varia]|uniref:Fatty acid desaturase n=1 Tax=Stieleria varia TaxID=2528005 RepID=A0A5C6B8H8_9BACT|nr:fatty acid desaturase [Stieleria varia]TWU07556.1 Fatty acid desaturase [Stieleria varia]